MHSVRRMCCSVVANSIYFAFRTRNIELASIILPTGPNPFVGDSSNRTGQISICMAKIFDFPPNANRQQGSKDEDIERYGVGGTNRIQFTLSPALLHQSPYFIVVILHRNHRYFVVFMAQWLACWLENDACGGQQ